MYSSSVVHVQTVVHERSRIMPLKAYSIWSPLGICLGQEIEPGVWAATAFALRFLNNAETKYSTNELEL